VISFLKKKKQKNPNNNKKPHKNQGALVMNVSPSSRERAISLHGDSHPPDWQEKLPNFKTKMDSKETCLKVLR
jgi:hypothetical protein